MKCTFHMHMHMWHNLNPFFYYLGLTELYVFEHEFFIVAPGEWWLNHFSFPVWLCSCTGFSLFRPFVTISDTWYLLPAIFFGKYTSNDTSDELWLFFTNRTQWYICRRQVERNVFLFLHSYIQNKFFTTTKSPGRLLYKSPSILPWTFSALCVFWAVVIPTPVNLCFSA